MKWETNCIKIDAPKRPKKITGTRLATILGLSPWSTAFEIWCEITKTYEKPFEDNIYTIAGKTIEPKQIQYMRKAYAMGNLRTPTDIYGKDYFNKTWGDFFKENAIFGGMWDSLLVGEDSAPEAVLEFKTTKRAEDWSEDVPEYYAIQAALYAYLLGVDDVIMVASFLEEKDYTAPEKFIPNAENTITVEFKVSERYPNFALMLDKATKWWNDHVKKAVSPAFDEKRDADILKALRTNSLSPDTDIQALLTEAETLKQEVEAVYETVADKEKRLKTVTDLIKQHAIKQFRAGDKKVSILGKVFDWVVSKTESPELDKEALKADGLFEKYSKMKPSYRITPTLIKEEK